VKKCDSEQSATESGRPDKALQTDCQGRPFLSLGLLPKADWGEGVSQHKRLSLVVRFTS